MRFALSDDTEFQVMIRIFCPAPVRVGIGFVQKDDQRHIEIGSLRRRESWTVPPIVVREAIMNAVVHTDYAQHGSPIRVAIFDDRIEG